MNDIHPNTNDKARRVTGWLILLFFPLFVGLGLWQLQRAEEKRTWRALVEKNLQAKPLQIRDLQDARSLDSPTASARRIQITGTFDTTHQYLLDNQVEQGQGGYWVLTPLRLEQHGIVLVNRGWIAAGSNRASIPDVSVTNEMVTLQGRITRPYRPILLLSHTEPERLAPGRLRLQYVDVPQIEKELGAPLLPMIMEMDAADPHGFARHWTLPVINAERHTAYAVQWFGLAVIVLFVHWRGSRYRVHEPALPLKRQNP